MKKLYFAGFIVFLLVSAGCGGGGSSNPPPPPPPPTDPDQRADLLLAKMTQDEKLQLVHGNLTIENGTGPHGSDGWVVGVPRLGIPDLLYEDGSVGVRSTTDQATALPSSMASAASWDVDEAYKYGQVIGKEMRALGLNVNFGGNVESHRTGAARWPNF